MFKYIIKASGHRALAVHSELNYFEFKDLVDSQCRQIHPRSTDRVWYYGVSEFFNPTVHTVEDFVNCCPALIGFKKD